MYRLFQRRNQRALLLLGMLLCAGSATSATPAWQLTTVDTFGVGVSVAISPTDLPGIAYAGSGIRYAGFDGTQWVKVGADTASACCTSLAMLPSGEPALAYYDTQNAVVKYTWREGGAWHTSVVDSGGTTVARPGLVILPSGLPAISYCNGATKYAWFDGIAWNTGFVDSGNASPSLAVLPSGYPAMAYRAADYSVKYAAFDGTNWQVTTVDTPPDYGLASLAILPSGYPAIAYGAGNYFFGSVLKYAWFDGNAWQTVTLDDAGGYSPALAMSPAGFPAVAHLDPLTNALKYTAFDGTKWTTTLVDTADEWFAGIGLAFPRSGHATIVYGSNETSTKVRCAVLLEPPVTFYVNGETGADTWTGLTPEPDGTGAGPKRTIQGGIGVAYRGDAVVIAPGQYTGAGNRDIDFGGRAVTVRSVDPNDDAVVAATVIDCQATSTDRHRAFKFATGETRDSILAGITITNGCAPLVAWPNDGNVPAGGAVLCWKSAPTINRCVFAGNQGTFGGAVLSSDPNWTGGNPRIARCTFHNNSAFEYNTGGTIFAACGGAMLTGAAELVDCRFSENSAAGIIWAAFGGAISLTGGSATISSCEFRGNSAIGKGLGGAICQNTGNVTVTNCVIAGNFAAGFNEAWYYQAGGGAVFSENGHGTPTMMTLVNCCVSHNSTSKRGGAVFAADSMVLTNCTLTGNTAGAGYAAIYHHPYSDTSMTVLNCVIWNGSQSIYSTSVRYSDIQGGWAGTGNINADPRFVDPDGPDGIPGTADDNLRLAHDSPCVDAGDNTAVQTGVSTDLDGDQRIADGNLDGTATVDMGAYEFQARLAGDTNCSGGVNSADISPFVLALSGRNAYEARYPGCDWLSADCNHDGVVSFADINPFVGLLSGS